MDIDVETVSLLCYTDRFSRKKLRAVYISSRHRLQNSTGALGSPDCGRPRTRSERCRDESSTTAHYRFTASLEQIRCHRFLTSVVWFILQPGTRGWRINIYEQEVEFYPVLSALIECTRVAATLQHRDLTFVKSVPVSVRSLVASRTFSV